MGDSEEVVSSSSQNRPATLQEAISRGLTPWKPGQSGNPGGRPKKLTRKLEEMLDAKDSKGTSYAEKFVKSFLERAIKRSDFAAKEIWERAEGKVPQAITGADGGPVQFQVAVVYGSADPQPQDVVVSSNVTDVEPVSD